MDNFILAVFASLVSIAIGSFIPSIFRKLNDWRYHYFLDVPEIEGPWIATFNEPDGVQKEIHVNLERIGNSVKGIGNIEGNHNDPFTFKAEIRRQTLVGTFKRLDKKVVVGTGSFMLKILADEQSWKDIVRGLTSKATKFGVRVISGKRSTNKPLISYINS